jgi:hypothetical protein
MLFGFAASYALAGPSNTHTRAVTTLPKPDPRPPPPPPPQPPPPPPPVAPPAAPPPPPPPVAPPPPPPTVVTRPKVRVPAKPAVKRHPPQPKKHRPRPRASATRTPPKQATDSLDLALLPAAAPRHDEVKPNSPAVVELGLGFTFGLSFLLFGRLAVPLRALPRPVRAVAYDRRETLLYLAVVIYITTGLSLAIALLMS